MSESAFNFRSSDEPSIGEDSAQEEEPRFGLIDIVEAFTAMRHEWRGQTKESRALAEQVQQAVQKLLELDSKWSPQFEESQSDDFQQAKQLAQLIADADHQLSRAVNAIAQAEGHRQAHQAADRQAIEQYFHSMSPLARWLARPLLTFVLDLHQRQDEGQNQGQEMTAESPAVEGLNLVLARLRQAMNEQQIERIDVLGQPFEGATMNAIGTMQTSDYAAGHVAEQLTPCYLWKGQILRFAYVRVAESATTEMEMEES